MLNPFSGSAYSVAALTAAINRLPNNFGLLNQMGLFPDRGVTQRTILVEENNGVLNLLATKPVGSPGSVGTIGKRKMRSFVVPHIPHDDTVMPDEVEGVRAFGSETEVETIAGKMAEKLAVMRSKHDITREHLRMGALKGIILDADGSTLYNLYTEFGITQKVIDMNLDSSGTDVLSDCMDIHDHIELNLKGSIMTGMPLALCSPSFFRAFVGHANVKAAFQYYQVNGQNLATDYRGGFVYGNIIWRQYIGSATDKDGNVRKFIADDQAHVIPMGTVGVFETINAPADFNETVNTVGMPYYAKQQERDFGRGWDIHTQSNPLPICYRPEVLVKLTLT
jgi:hypothetical protein